MAKLLLFQSKLLCREEARNASWGRLCPGRAPRCPACLHSLLCEGAKPGLCPHPGRTALSQESASEWLDSFWGERGKSDLGYKSKPLGCNSKLFYHQNVIFDAYLILFFGEGNGNPLQYSCLENSLERGAWRTAVHGVEKSWTRLSDSHWYPVYFSFCPEPVGVWLSLSEIPVLIPSHWREWNNAIGSNRDRPRDCPTEWTKSDREGELLYDIP